MSTDWSIIKATTSNLSLNRVVERVLVGLFRITKIQVFRFSTCQNDVVDVFSCASDGGLWTGDTYTRHVNHYGTDLAVNDGSCGMCIKIVFEITTNGRAKNSIRQDCFGSSSCGGQLSITSMHPTGQPASKLSDKLSCELFGRPLGQPTVKPFSQPSGFWYYVSHIYQSTRIQCLA